jgi:hypothetical protein
MNKKLYNLIIMSRLVAAMALTSASSSIIPWFEVDSIKNGSGYCNLENNRPIKIGDFVKCDQKIRNCYPNTPKHIIALDIDEHSTGSAILADYLRDPIIESQISDEYLRHRYSSGICLTEERDIENFKKYNKFVPRLGFEEFKDKKQQVLKMTKDEELKNIVYSTQYPTDKAAIDFLKVNMVEGVLINYDTSGLENALEFVKMIKSAKTEDNVLDCLSYLFVNELVKEFAKTNTEEIDSKSIVKSMFNVNSTKNGFTIATSKSFWYGMPFITIEKHDDITNVKFYSPHPKFGMMKALYTTFVYEDARLKEIIADNV